MKTGGQVNTVARLVSSQQTMFSWISDPAIHLIECLVKKSLNFIKSASVVYLRSLWPCHIVCLVRHSKQP